jgi:hypothetical protein
MALELSGFVASLINERELAINLGSEAGVTEGMKFQVLEKPRTIIDPPTKTELGIVQREKVKVKVVEVYPKFCIARTYETYQVETSRAGYRLALDRRADISPGFGGFSETKVRTLRSADRPGLEPIDPSASYVEIGDPVKLLRVAQSTNTSEQRAAG